MPRFILPAIVISVWAISAYALPHALDVEYDNNQAAIELHKDSLRSTQSAPAEHSYNALSAEDFKKANQHANECLRANRERTRHGIHPEPTKSVGRSQAACSR